MLSLLVGAWLGLTAWPAAAQMFRSYENTTSGAIPFANTNAVCATGGLVRTFSVPESFSFDNVALGLRVSHTNRGDLRVLLTPPGGAQTLLFAQDGTDTQDNFDILLTTNSEEALRDGDTDPTTAPYYSRLATNAPLAAAPFASGSANGTWTLRVCDRNNNAINGTFESASLVLRSGESAPTRCTSTVSYDWGTPGAVTPLTGNPVTVGDITISQQAETDHGGTASTAFVMRPTTNGNHTGYYGISMDASAVGGTQDNEAVGLTSVIGFSVPISELRFTLLDVDITTNAWEDQVEVLGQDLDGNRIPHTLSLVGAATQLAGNVAEGDASAATTSTAGNVDVAFAGAISTLTLNYTQGSNPASENVFMVVGLSDFQQCAFDFGDAPATYGTPLSNGPKHVLGGRRLYLGANPPDGEGDGQANGAAAGDDFAAVGSVDDEDGLDDFFFPTCPLDGTYSVTLTVNNASGSTGYLVGYIDWNRDGDFGEANERSDTVSVGAVTNGTPVVSWSSVPSNCGGDAATYARFRFTTSQVRAESPIDAAGVSAPDGEVEDYQIGNGTLPVTIAYVASAVADGQLTVRWTTASEWANAGFALWGRGGSGEWRLLAEVPTAGADSLAPQRYETTVEAGDVDAIKLEDLSLLGKRREHGPYAVGETAGDVPQGMEIDWAAVKAENEAAPAGAGGALRLSAMATGATEGLLLVREEGIHRVTHEQLLAAGIDLSGVKPAQIALIDEGAGTPRHVTTTGATFGPGSTIEFYARPRLTLASPTDAIVIRQDKKRAVVPRSLTRGNGGRRVVEAVDTHAVDAAYSFASPNGDPWLEKALMAWGAPASLTRTFDLPDLETGPAELTVRTWGYGAFTGNLGPDHHVVITLNGTVVADGRFDGIAPYEPTVDVTAVARAAGNVLEVTVPGDNGHRYDYVAYEGFSVRYRRGTVARDGRFAGAVEGRDGFLVGGFADGATVSLWRQEGATWERGEQVAAGGEVAVGRGGATWAAAADRLLAPEVVAGVPAPQQLSSAQYVIVTHPAFAGSLADLVALEESRGFTTEVVTVDSIYAAYSDHAVSAQALKRFFAASLQKGTLRNVVLVGADTTDPYDHLGRGSMSFVPTEYRAFLAPINYSPTDEGLVDADGDSLGEVPIGRLPVRTAAELREVIAKLKAWEANLAGAGRSAFLAAGLSDADSTLPPLNTAYAGALGGWATTLAHADEQGTAAVRAAVLAALNGGTPLVSFVGHSSMGQWDTPALLKWQDAATLTNAGRPSLVVQWGCWNSYYVEPTVESLAAHLLRAPGAGVAAAIGATTLTSDVSHQALGARFFAQVNGGARTLGEAFHNAKRDLRSMSVASDALLGMTLLGDPATPLPR